MILHLNRWHALVSPSLLLLLTALPLGCAKAPPPADEEMHPAPIKAVASQKHLLGEWTELLGTTQPLPNRAARLSAAIEGRVLSTLGDGKGSTLVEGQEVHVGQVIVQLDDRIARANRDKVAASQAEIVEQKKQADYGVELAQIEVKRLEELGRTASTGAPLPLVSRIELEKARIALKDAESKQKAVAARIEAAKAELAALDEQLDYYKVKAPIKGRLGAIQVVPGQTLTVGMTIADIVDLEDIDVLCFVPPHAASRLALDQSAHCAFQRPTPDQEQSVLGKVAFIAVQAQPETGNFAVKVRFPNRDLNLRANRVLSVQVLTKPRQERLTIPETALLEDQDPPGVVVVQEVETKKDKEGKEEKFGKARKLRALLGVRDRAQHVVEILGLEDPDKKEKIAPEKVLFIIEGAHGLQTNDPVKLEETEQKEDK